MNKKKGHPENAGYRPSDHWSVCDICGREFRKSDLKETWDHRFVCRNDWEPRPELEPAHRRGEFINIGKIAVFGNEPLSDDDNAGPVDFVFPGETEDNDPDTTTVDQTDDDNHVIPDGTNNNDLTEIVVVVDVEACSDWTGVAIDNNTWGDTDDLTWFLSYSGTSHQLLPGGEYLAYLSTAKVIGTLQMSTPYDISTLGNEKSLDISATVNALGSVMVTSRVLVADSGTKFYAFVRDLGPTLDISYVLQYTMSTPYDASTATLDYTESLGTAIENVQAINISDDGTQGLMLYDIPSSSNKRKTNYTLSTPWDFRTFSRNNSSDFTSDFTNNPKMVFGCDGAKLYRVDYTNNLIGYYNLSTAYDIATLGSRTDFAYDLQSLFLRNMGDAAVIGSMMIIHGRDANSLPQNERFEQFTFS